MYASDFFEIGRNRFVQIEIGMGVKEHHGHVSQKGFSVRKPDVELFPAHFRGFEIRVLEVQTYRHVIDHVPDALQKRFGFGIR